ncbi:MAG: type I secretion system permease/ATPase [Coriobacteriales bacterium]|jgi:subfamily B ATP-binding cassette protein HlyB/CyaB|nr:type I secretion system permease/ATPase [Coriobacteriales bacterium]
MAKSNGSSHSGAACLIIAMRMLGLATDQVQEELSRDNTPADMDALGLVALAQKCRLKAKLHRFKKNKPLSIRSLLIACGKNGQFFIIAKAQGDECVVLFPDKATPEVVSLRRLWAHWDGTALLLGKRATIDTKAAFGFKWFIPTILKFKREFIQVLIAVFIMQILGILTPVMMQVVIDKVLVQQGLSTLYSLAIGIGFVYVFEFVLGLAKNYVFTHTTNRIDVILSFKLFGHLFGLPLKYFKARKVGEIVARVRELDTIRNFLTGTPLSTAIDLVFVVVYIIVLFFYSTNLTLIVLASIPIFALLSAVVTPLFKKRLDEKFQAGAQTQSFLVESISGIETVKSFAVEPQFINRWGDLQADYVQASYRTAMVSATAASTGQFIQRIFELLVLFFGALAVMDGTFSVGQLVAFRMLSSRVSGPILRLVQLWQEYQQAALSVKKIADIFSFPLDEPQGPSNVSVPRLHGTIVFDHVSFRYHPTTQEVIKNMSFRIEAGTVVGVVGRSGSGKSTLSLLIQRLYIAQAGKITIDGMDIAMLSPAAFRKQIGVVLQENYLFNGSVRKNISLHHPGASLEQIVQCAKTAGAHDFITELPQGYDTIVGEQGMGLSGGQKQRIAIARAILNDPRILIFDEATSALDYESESIIQHNLKEICKDRTVIIIAHRLSTLREAHMIMVVDQGTLLECGTHENLLAACGFYSALHHKQMLGAIDG